MVDALKVDMQYFDCANRVRAAVVPQVLLRILPVLIYQHQYRICQHETNIAYDATIACDQDSTIAYDISGTYDTRTGYNASPLWRKPLA